MANTALDQLEALAPTAGSDAPLWATLAAALREVQAGRGEAARAPVLTTEQAAEAANLASTDAFYRWAKKWRVHPVGHDRWSRRAIELGLDREAKNVLHRNRARRGAPCPAAA